MRVVVTGGSGLVGRALVAELGRRGHELRVLSRNPKRAEEALRGVPATGWDPVSEPAPSEALEGFDAVVHLAGENIAQRWSGRAKRAIRDSRVLGTRNLIAGLEGLHSRPATLICSSAVGIYGARREEPLDEDAPIGYGFLAELCAAWEAEARRAASLQVRVVTMRTGVVLDADEGALAKMLPPFRLGIGGPVAGGHQYISWIHLDDLARMFAEAIEDESWTGPVNATAPEPVTNRQFSHALGETLHRPAFLPVPAFALGLLYGEMAEIVTTGQRVLPAKALILGYEFRHPHLREALESALG